MGLKIKDIGEINFIKSVAKRAAADSSVVKGVGDDAAVLKWTKDKYLLFTCDMLVENVHFRLRDAKPFEIGWKALGRSISDIAAMGGVPRHAVVAIGVRPETPVKFLDNIYKGIRALADKFRINIVGGDTSRSQITVIDISLVGEVEKRNLVLRSGARTGDLILVTGAIGGSLKGKHLNFTPRLAEARRIVGNFKVNSMIDISDGLILDMWRIIDASRVGARIYKNAVPISKEADSFEKGVRDGEDFELLFTMAPKEARRFFKTALADMATPVTLIGEVVDKKYGYNIVKEDGREEKLRVEGYLHF